MAVVTVYNGTPGPSDFDMDCRYPYLFLGHLAGTPVPANAGITYDHGIVVTLVQGMVLECQPGSVHITGVGPYRICASDSMMEAFQLGR